MFLFHLLSLSPHSLFSLSLPGNRCVNTTLDFSNLFLSRTTGNLLRNIANVANVANVAIKEVIISALVSTLSLDLAAYIT